MFVQPRLFHCDDSLRLPVPRAGGALFTVADYHGLCGRARNSIWNAWDGRFVNYLNGRLLQLLVCSTWKPYDFLCFDWTVFLPLFVSKKKGNNTNIILKQNTFGMYMPFCPVLGSDVCVFV